MRAVAAAMFAGILAGAGCRADRQEPVVATKMPEMESFWQSTPVPSNAQPMPVKVGAAPLVYRVEGGATIRVRDENAKLDLARGYVPAGSIVRVDARRGVIYGEDTVYAGPLAENGRYVIFVEPTGENVARQGTVQPRPSDAR